MKCYSCNTENPDGSMFCSECGEKLQVTDNSFKETEIVPAEQKVAPQCDNTCSDNTAAFNEYIAETVYPKQNTVTNYFNEATKNASTAPYGYESVYPDKSRIRAEAFSISSFVISLVNLCTLSLNIPFAIVGLIFGIIGVKSSKKGFSITGIILSAISLVAFFFIIYLIILVILNFNDYPTEYSGTFLNIVSNCIDL